MYVFRKPAQPVCECETHAPESVCKWATQMHTMAGCWHRWAWPTYASTQQPLHKHDVGSGILLQRAALEFTEPWQCAQLPQHAHAAFATACAREQTACCS